MKLLHTSDWHLGQSFMGQSRAREHGAFLAWLVDRIEAQSVDLLLVSGDIFDTGTPPNYALELYYNFLKQLSQIKTLTATIITAGNHDSIATLKAPKELLKVLNVHVITSGEGDEEVVIPISIGGVTEAIVCAVPFLREGTIRQSLGGEGVSERERQANRGIKAYYERCHAKALLLRGESAIPIIATGHLTTVGARTSESEKDIYIGGTIDIGGDYLGGMFDYVALGHLHTAQKVGSESVRYSGSPIPLSFSESQKSKSVNLVTLDSMGISVEEIEVPLTQRLIVLKGSNETISKALTQIEEPTAWIEVHLKDDNPNFANQAIREQALASGLTLLAVKIDKTEKHLQAKELGAINLDEISVEDVFRRRLELEAIDDELLKSDLISHFTQVAQKVQTL